MYKYVMSLSHSMTQVHDNIFVPYTKKTRYMFLNMYDKCDSVNVPVTHELDIAVVRHLATNQRSGIKMSCFVFGDDIWIILNTCSKFKHIKQWFTGNIGGGF